MRHTRYSDCGRGARGCRMCAKKPTHFLSHPSSATAGQGKSSSQRFAAVMVFYRALLCSSLHPGIEPLQGGSASLLHHKPRFQGLALAAWVLRDIHPSFIFTLPTYHNSLGKATSAHPQHTWCASMIPCCVPGGWQYQKDRPSVHARWCLLATNGSIRIDGCVFT